MVESALVTENQSCFQFKASFSPCTIMQLSRYDLDELGAQLAVTVARAPYFFQGSPVVLDLESIKNIESIDFFKLKKILLDQNMVPVGVRGGSEEQHLAATTAGMPVVAVGRTTTNVSVSEQAPQTKKTAQALIPVMQQTKVITTPIRSGMQIYAKDSDLIILAPVSAGAELLADGHIHIYGPLRGRALAGVQGNMQARIFCHTLEAELVAISGYYLVKEDIQAIASKGLPVQIYLENEQVKIEAI